MKLLLALDIDDRPEDVLAAAVEWARRLRAQLDLLYVDEYHHQLEVLADASVRDLITDQWARIRAEHEARLASMLLTIPEENRGQALYRAGRPADEIVAAAAGRDAVIVATHGRQGLGHVLMGSVAEKVVRRAEVPVIVLRLPEPAERP